MKTAFNVSMIVLLLISSTALAQDSSLFPNKLDPEGLSRSSNLVPPPILSDQGASVQPQYRVAKTQEPQTWQSTPVLGNSRQIIDEPQAIVNEFWSANETITDASQYDTRDDDEARSVTDNNIIGEKIIGNNTATHASPLIRIETITPSEASTYIESTIAIKVSNQGPTLAESVDLTVELSNNVDVVSTKPANVARQNGRLYFKLGELENGRDTQVLIIIKANKAGEITVRPRVSLAATSQASIKAIKPSVELRVHGNDEVIAGTGITRQIEVSNNGREAIRNLRINAISANNLISNISFSGENQIIEWLAPGESRRFDFEAAAVAPGNADLTFAVSGDNIRAEFKNPMTIAQRTIQTQVNGPELAYKNSPGTYSIEIANEAPTDAENVQIVLELPLGMDIQVVDREAHYNQSRTQLTWSIPRLQAGASESIPFKAALKNAGTHKLKVLAVSNKKILSDSHMNTHVVGRANINLQVTSMADAVEIGNTTSIEVKVTNDGSEAAGNIRLAIQLPESVRAVPMPHYEIQGSKLIVQPFDLEVGRKKTIVAKLIGAASGEFVIRATAGSDSTTNEISSEKNLFFFSGMKE